MWEWRSVQSSRWCGVFVNWSSPLCKKPASVIILPSSLMDVFSPSGIGQLYVFHPLKCYFQDAVQSAAWSESTHYNKAFQCPILSPTISKTLFPIFCESELSESVLHKQMPPAWTWKWLVWAMTLKCPLLLLSWSCCNKTHYIFIFVFRTGVICNTAMKYFHIHLFQISISWISPTCKQLYHAD